jgi:hypothetical protein
VLCCTPAGQQHQQCRDFANGSTRSTSNPLLSCSAGRPAPSSCHSRPEVLRMLLLLLLLVLLCSCSSAQGTGSYIPHSEPAFERGTLSDYSVTSRKPWRRHSVGVCKPTAVGPDPS